jgi:hypothetical protein
MNFILGGTIYPFDIMVSIGQSDKELKKELNKYFPKQYAKGNLWQYSSETSLGCAVMFEGNQSLIRLRSKPKTPKEYSTMIHECLHITQFIMERVGIELKVNISDEAYCYLHAWIIEQILLKLKIKLT